MNTKAILYYKLHYALEVQSFLVPLVSTANTKVANTTFLSDKHCSLPFPNGCVALRIVSFFF